MAAGLSGATGWHVLLHAVTEHKVGSGPAQILNLYMEEVTVQGIMNKLKPASVEMTVQVNYFISPSSSFKRVGWDISSLNMNAKI